MSRNDQADQIRQGCSMLWLLAVAAIMIGGSIIIIAFPPMSRDEARDRIATSNENAPIDIPDDVLECAMAGECYSWGGKTEPWHKVLLVPLGLFAIGWIVAIHNKLRSG